MRSPLSREQVQELYEEALSRRSPEALAAAGADLGALALADAARNQQSGKLNHLKSSGLDVIVRPDVRARFERSFDSAERLFGRICLPPPTPEELATAGIDLAYLADEYVAMERGGLEPALILAPNLPLSDWQVLYDDLTADTTISGNPLRTDDDGNGLLVSKFVTNEWASLCAPREAMAVHNGEVGAYSTGWTLRLVPATAEPRAKGTSYDAHERKGGHHQLIQEYLTLQASRIQDGLPPVDPSTNSWCQSSADFKGSGASRAPYGHWDFAFGQVRILWSDSSDSEVDLGVRSSVE